MHTQLQYSQFALDTGSKEKVFANYFVCLSLICANPIYGQSGRLKTQVYTGKRKYRPQGWKSQVWKRKVQVAFTNLLNAEWKLSTPLLDRFTLPNTDKRLGPMLAFNSQEFLT